MVARQIKLYESIDLFNSCEATDNGHQLTVQELCYYLLGPISLEVGGKERLALSGPSGAGKSLFLRALADLDVHQGEVRCDDREAESMPASEWRRQVGLLPASHSWWADLVGDHFHSMDFSALAELGFDPDVMQWSTSRLSSGEKQRLALLRLLCNRPSVLLLDEPTANLDTKNTRQVENLLLRYQSCRQSPLIVVSHNPTQIRRFCTRWVEIRENEFIELNPETHVDSGEED